MRRAPASLGLLARLLRGRDGAAVALDGVLRDLRALQAGQLPSPDAACSGSGSTLGGLHTFAPSSSSGTWALNPPANDRCPLAQGFRPLPPSPPAVRLLQAAGMSKTAAASNSSSSRRPGRPTLVSQDSEEDIAAAHQQLAAYLQQQGGISQADAADSAGKLSAKLGAAADQLVRAPLQWFVGRGGMRPLKAAQLLVHTCTSSATYASTIRQWPTWQPVFEANWQLVDSYLAAYQQQCRATKQKPRKGSESMAAILSSQPSRYHLLLVRDLPSKLAALQQGQLGLSVADVGQLVAAGLMLSGTPDTIASAIQWLVRFAGSTEAGFSMLRAAPVLLNYTAATLDSKVAALQAAWAGVLQREQLQQLVPQHAVVLQCSAKKYQPTAAVLHSWFLQPSELFAVLQHSPALLSASATTMQANERWFTSPPLSLSRQEFLELVRTSPQVFCMSFADDTTQHKLAFLTQVGGVPLERALSASQLTYLKSSIKALAGSYFLLIDHGMPVPRHGDGGIVLGYATDGLPTLLRRMRRHDSQGSLPADDDAALAYIRRWLAAWPETETGRRWAQPPAKAARK